MALPGATVPWPGGRSRGAIRSDLQTDRVKAWDKPPGTVKFLKGTGFRPAGDR